MKRTLQLLIFVAIFVMAAWYGLVTESRVLKLTEKYLGPYGYSCDLKGFSRSVPFAIHIERLVFKAKPEFDVRGQNSAGKYLFQRLKASGLEIDDVSLRLSPFTISLKLDATIFNGDLKGQVGLLKDLLVRIENIDMRQVGRFFGVELGGRLNGEFVSNRLRLRLRDAKLVDAVIDNQLVPLGLFTEITSAFTISDDAIEIDQVLLVGKEGRARIEGGRLSRGKIDLTIVFLPAEDDLWSLLLGKYRVKKGYYSIPVKRRLSLGN